MKFIYMRMSLESQLEAILFVSGEPIAIRKLAGLVQEDPDRIHEALEALRLRLDGCDSALQLVVHEHQAELVTRGEYAELVRALAKDQAQGELSKPAMEALSILAYRGPLTRPELEQIRGVQSSMILRNLMLRGLVEQTEEVRIGQPVYRVTIEFLKHLGVEAIEDLPDYELMREHPNVTQVLGELAPTQQGLSI